MRKKRVFHTETTQKQIAEAYSLGEDGPILAKKYDVSVATIYRYVRLCGGYLRSRGENNRRRGNARQTPIDYDALVQMIDAGFSTTEIAKRLAITQPTIEMRLKKLGLHSKHGNGFPMEKNHFWRSGRTVDTDGYILVKAPRHPHAMSSGYIREHRLVMERKLGRYLDRTEIVHHKNEDKADNHPDNLEVFSSIGDHTRHHDPLGHFYQENLPK